MFKARQAIIARRAACPIGHQIDGDGATACGIGQNIVMRVANKRIITKAAIQGIRAIIAIQRIIAASASQRIGRSIAQQAICPRAADHMFEAGQAIIARAAACPIGRQVHRNRAKHGSVGQKIQARATGKAVITQTTIQRISAAATCQSIGRRITKQAICACAADHIFKGAQAIIACRAAGPIADKADRNSASGQGIGQ